MLGFRSVAVAATKMPPGLVAWWVLLNVPGVVTGIWGDLDTGYLERLFVQLDSTSVDRSVYSTKIIDFTVDWKEKVLTQPKMPKHLIPENISKWYSTLNCKFLLVTQHWLKVLKFKCYSLIYFEYFNIYAALQLDFYLKAVTIKTPSAIMLSTIVFSAKWKCQREKSASHKAGKVGKPWRWDNTHIIVWLLV